MVAETEVAVMVEHRADAVAMMAELVQQPDRSDQPVERQLGMEGEALCILAGRNPCSRCL